MKFEYIIDSTDIKKTSKFIDKNNSLTTGIKDKYTTIQSLKLSITYTLILFISMFILFYVSIRVDLSRFLKIISKAGFFEIMLYLFILIFITFKFIQIMVNKNTTKEQLLSLSMFKGNNTLNVDNKSIQIYFNNAYIKIDKNIIANIFHNNEILYIISSNNKIIYFIPLYKLENTSQIIIAIENELLFKINNK